MICFFHNAYGRIILSGGIQMPILLEISDIEDEVNEGPVRKILYVLEDDADQTVTACFYHNDDDITDDEIRAEFDDICEEDELERVGSLGIDDEEGWLRDIEVDANYRRMGIGSTLIRLAIDHGGLTNIACVQENDAYEYDLTVEGENLIAYCVREGIIPPGMCHFAHHVPLSEDASGDPGQSSFMVRNAIPGGYQAHNHDHYQSSEEDEPDYSDENEPDYPDDDAPNYSDEDEPDYPDGDEPDYPDDDAPNYSDLDGPDYPGNEGDEINIAVPSQATLSPLLSSSAFFKKEKGKGHLLEENPRRTPSPTNG